MAMHDDLNARSVPRLFLVYYRQSSGDRFHFGAVLYAGEFPYQLDEQIRALPISFLWQGSEFLA